MRRVIQMHTKTSHCPVFCAAKLIFTIMHRNYLYSYNSFLVCEDQEFVILPLCRHGDVWTEKKKAELMAGMNCARPNLQEDFVALLQARQPEAVICSSLGG